ncbi:DNA repair protein RadC [Alphaproteobacteria bacterium]
MESESGTFRPSQDNSGHRTRLRERFAKVAIRSFPDYEILELLLFQVIARRDTKKLAKDLLSHFGSLHGVIFADSGELMAITGIGETVANYLRLLSDLFSRLCIPIRQQKINVLNNWLSVLNYCKFTMGFKKHESFRVLFLNKKNILIADEFFNTGTVDKIAIYPREIARYALLYGACAIILIHNHPSRDINPSKEDIEITQKVIGALAAVNVTMHDHLIIAGDEYFSFRGNDLL